MLGGKVTAPKDKLGKEKEAQENYVFSVSLSLSLPPKRDQKGWSHAALAGVSCCWCSPWQFIRGTENKLRCIGNKMCNKTIVLSTSNCHISAFWFTVQKYIRVLHWANRVKITVTRNSRLMDKQVVYIHIINRIFFVIKYYKHVFMSTQHFSEASHILQRDSFN